MKTHHILATLLASALAVTAASRAEAQPVVPPVQPSIDQDKQKNLSDAHSVLQKTGLATLGVTGVLGAMLAVNQETAFGPGRCITGNDPVFGSFGCNGLKYLHFGFAATTLGLFIATEVVAEKMPISPYEMGDQTKRDAMKTLRVANIALFSVQPVLGLIAANHSAFGLSTNAAAVLRTIHLGVGGTVAGTYTANTVLQW